MKRKLFSVLMTGVLALGMIPAVALADGCEHHKVHTEDCGYKAAVEGKECTHVHDESCYPTVVDYSTGAVYSLELLDCEHKDHPNGEIDGCGFVRATEGSACSFNPEECTECEMGITAYSDTVEEIEPTYDWYINGTYEIDSVGDLVGLAKITRGNVTVDGTAITKDNFEEKTVKLTSDITFADNQYWYYNDGTTVIDYQIKDFAGDFYGNDNSIIGLKFKNTADVNPSLGLFNKIMATGSVSHLILDTVNADINTYDQFGFIARTLYGDASYCEVKNVTITAKGYHNYSGGLFGTVGDKDNHASVSYCKATNVNFTTDGNDNSDCFGGAIGNTSYASVSNCEGKDITFTFTRKTKRTGGFIGYVANSNISDCLVTNVVIKVDKYPQSLGGFVGETSGTNSFTNCTIAGSKITLDDKNYASTSGAFAGFAGQFNGGTNTFYDCHVTDLDITVCGQPYNGVGGFVASTNANATFDQCSVSGKIDAENIQESIPVGGFLGDVGWTNGYNIVITDCTADVDIIAKGDAGGFVAAAWPEKNGNQNATLTIKDSEATGDVTSLNGAAGGFVGTGNRGTFENCTATGNVSGDTAGGFWGELIPNNRDDFENDIVINNCESTGVVVGSTQAGGFIGDDIRDNDTSASANGNTASSVVIGTNSSTTINEFAPEKTTNENQDNTNTGAASVLKAVDSSSTVEINSDGTLKLDGEFEFASSDGEDKVIIEADGVDVTIVDGEIHVPANATVVVDGKTYTADEDGIIITPEGIVGENDDSGDSGTPVYSTSDALKDYENGEVKANFANPSAGVLVTLTVTPDEGYEVGEITITDENGKEIEVIDNGDGTYSYRQPESEIEIDVEFVEIEEKEDKPEEEPKAEIILTIGNTNAIVNGEIVTNDVAPVIRNGRTMLPIRFIVEELGGKIEWNDELKKVTITKGDLTIEIFIGSPFAIVNGNIVELDSPAFIENDRTYLPLRFVADYLGADVEWIDETKTVTITEK